MNVAAVASEEPLIAENPAQAPIVAMGRAPRRPANSALAATNNSCDMPERVATAPIRMNRGSTENAYWVSEYGVSPKTMKARSQPSIAA